jgi:hypothetical protein
MKHKVMACDLVTVVKELLKASAGERASPELTERAKGELVLNMVGQRASPALLCAHEVLMTPIAEGALELTIHKARGGCVALMRDLKRGREAERELDAKASVGAVFDVGALADHLYTIPRRTKPLKGPRALMPRKQARYITRKSEATLKEAYAPRWLRQKGGLWRVRHLSLLSQ